MPDIIHLLPDNIANQIAAGEVIQKPASAVKELMENAIDAEATEITVLIQDAGKTLVQVIDNGKGMSETDARMCFERHATSKINTINDLFKIKTMGFRGEALASIAAVAQIVLKTKKETDELGTLIEIENSVITKHEPCVTQTGTNFSMKNLFFNVPARRNFLKSDNLELKFIIDEFCRIAFAFPTIVFKLLINGTEKFHLTSGTLKQRCVQILGNKYNAQLISVHQKTDYVQINGFIGKPEIAKKTRGDQYFFINNRFIKSFYLNYAIANAFENLIPKDSFATYIIFIEIDPANIDINVHPTKQEIKFEDEKIIYAFLHAAIKHALAQYQISPSLDFTLNAEIQNLPIIQKPHQTNDNSIQGTALYQNFKKENQAHFIQPQNNNGLKNWQDYFTDLPKEGVPLNLIEVENKLPNQPFFILYDYPFLQIKLTYILVPTNTGFILVHQQYAHERIIYENMTANQLNKQVHIQKLLFPIVFELSPADAILLEGLLNDLQNFGYEIELFGNNNFIIQGIPSDINSGNEVHAIEMLLEQFKHFKSDITFSKREKLIRCITRSQAIKTGKTLNEIEMKELIEKLFLTSTPNTTINGYPVFIDFKENYLDSLFTKKI